MRFYKLTICGLNRELPIVGFGPRLKIASFSLLGDAELIGLIAQELVERIKYFQFDFLVGPELKVLPLIYEMSKILGQERYIICRKKITGYMTRPLKSGGRDGLVLNRPDADLITGKKVVIVDDVVSSGRTIKVVSQLMKKAKAGVVCIASVLKQGELKEKLDVPFFYLSTLPLFKK